MRDDLINNHTCISINSDSGNGLIIMGGIYFETVIYFLYFVMEIKPFCTSKTVSSIVSSLNHSCPKSLATLTGNKTAKKCSSTNMFLNED